MMSAQLHCGSWDQVSCTFKKILEESLARSEVIYISHLRSLGACVDLKVSSYNIKVILRYTVYETILKVPIRLTEEDSRLGRLLIVYLGIQKVHSRHD